MPGVALASAGGANAEVLRLEDDCDKPSWDAAFGPEI
jgi:hypothetical protein